MLSGDTDGSYAAGALSSVNTKKHNKQSVAYHLPPVHQTRSLRYNSTRGILPGTSEATTSEQSCET
eukprot:scaffold112462_cov46-Attheya_sp.AAC.3